MRTFLLVILLTASLFGSRAVRAELCVADCDVDAAVSINELVTAVNIALGESMVDRCVIADRNANGSITVDELVAGVQSALGGCGPQRVFLRDEQGRALTLHGANVSGSSKSSVDRVPELGREDFLRLSGDFGFNLARYLILWDALEPQPGQVDSAYLDRIKERLDWLHEAGVYVVLDMHQDVYAARFCCDGAPLWAIRDDGESFVQQSTWAFNYFQPAVMRAFDNFFGYQDPNKDLQDHYAAAWRAVAARFHDHPAVLGYDLMNEPSPGSYFNFDEIRRVESPNGSSAQFDRDFLGPFYERIAAQIRTVDPDKWIFYEPRYGSPSTGMPSYIGKLDDPRPGEDRFAYFPHLYSLVLESGGGYTQKLDPTIPDWARRRTEEIEALQEPLIIGEFGITEGLRNGLLHVTDVLAMAETVTSGWAFWDYCRGGGYCLLTADGQPTSRLQALVQPYAQRVAGTPLYSEWDPVTRVYWLAFATDPTIDAPTEIFIPIDFYAGGFSIQVSGPEGSSAIVWDISAPPLRLFVDESAPTRLIRIAPQPNPPLGD